MSSTRTYFNGVWYRSRLEAYWAAFFTEIGMQFDYEPKMIPLLAGWYVPDFWLRRERVWLEVKGDSDQLNARKYNELVNSTGTPLVCLIGAPWPTKYVASLFSPKRYREYYPVLVNAELAGYHWDKKTLWIMQDDRYINLKRQWERPAVRAEPPAINCQWIAAAMQRGKKRLHNEGADVRYDMPDPVPF